MKYLKKILFFILFLILFFIFVLILDYARLNISYLICKKNYVEVFEIPGNTSNYVPQGLAYSKRYNVVLQTSYNSKHDVSMLYVIDFETGKLLKELKLIETDDSNNTNHVGGITTNENTVWITNDYEVNEFSLEEIISTNNDYIKSLKNTPLPNRGDFCMYNDTDNTLYIGDFFLNPFYPVPDNNPLLLGYKINNFSDSEALSSENIVDYSTPDFIISLPKMIQGMVITNDNKFVFTGSFTPFIKSELSIYDNVVSEKPVQNYNLNGKTIPNYKLNKDNLVKKIKLPPMAEGMFNLGNELYILFENSSNTYFYAFPKLKRVIKIII